MREGILSQHTCKAVVLACIDFRFGCARLSHALKEAYNLHDNEYDVIALPGGAQNVTQYAFAQDHKDAMRRALEVAIDLHHVESIIALSHQNCGALKAIGRTFGAEEASAETVFHEDLLAEARDTLASLWPALKIEVGYLCVPDGEHVMLHKVG
ncbi:MAG: hypothetical protein G01um101448_753 [Parcubacteria group bacterium Gr01-1014_48]|nr:MAG: hypothetical protein Greene041614_534 [Parcubacteria group bacterium Greene0416_14]TSC73485.1 MAG: hypothetical protein G01um101448_753 [Parcubacteria group bacterium Gr01-1014_48]TSD00548.1 MAG: hypothetical protein Greene101415_769 [Parcubacteria group bacterium Greene1014_15]TSD08241.1 MAG: hypothetical protein Greene07144_223 [Parcubacteria group bacterium Greene0714_4]